MSPKDADVYLLSGAGEDEWVNPTPARSAIVDALTEATDVDADEVADLDEYVHPEEVKTVLDSEDDSLTVDIEDHEVTISADGTVTVED